MSAAPLPPGVERRKQLRRQRRADRLRNFWRLLVFSAISAGLGWVLLRQGWILRSPAQVEVQGSVVVNRDQVIEAAGLRFPQPLLDLNPRQLGRSLAATLPVENVQVSRLMLPARLRVQLADRQAVARAQRRTPKGVEQGYVDREGNWISVPIQPGVRMPGNAEISVVGWTPRHRPALATILAAAERIGPGLREIRFEPDGTLWLRTAELGSLRLGPSDDRLERRLEVVEHLARSLPDPVRRRRPRMIDLTDPEQPELSLPASASPAAAAGGAATPSPSPAE